MKSLFHLFFLAFASIAGAVALADGCAASPVEPECVAAVKRDFADPPREYGVNCWWWWLNGNTDKAAISRELAAMKEKKFH